MKTSLFIQDQFSKHAISMRKVFDSRFENPKITHSQRFTWDYWHVPNQYTLVRTPANQYFPQKLYQNFLQDLGRWGRENLGCSAITSPWLSYYVEGCEQHLHSDVPHGPWAFVFSLSPKKIWFQGGETLLLRSEVLDYWSHFLSLKNRELNSFVKKITPKFNRLVVFDPRIPHGVTPVTGTKDPREARLVLHGWFTEPKPYLEGALRANQVAPQLDEAMQTIFQYVNGLGEWHGVMSIRLTINQYGSVKAKILANTFAPLSWINKNINEKKIIDLLEGLKFARTHGATKITLPIISWPT